MMWRIDLAMLTCSVEGMRSKDMCAYGVGPWRRILPMDEFEVEKCIEKKETMSTYELSLMVVRLPTASRNEC